MPKYFIIVMSEDWDFPDVQFAETESELRVVLEDVKNCGYDSEVYEREYIGGGSFAYQLASCESWGTYA